MTVRTHVITATIDPAGLNAVVPVTAGTITSDASWVPFHQGQITFPIGDLDLSAYLPSTVLPVRIDAEVLEEPDSEQQWNLHARHIRRDQLAGEYTVELASAEALVQEWGADTVTTTFAAGRTLSLICQDILRRVLGNPTLIVGADTPNLQIANELRVWAAGVPAWDYLAEIVNSMDGRTLAPTPAGGWTIQPAIGTGTSPGDVPQAENTGDALSLVEEWSRNTDYGNAVTVEYTGGDPTYTTFTVPGSSPAVNVQVEVRSFGRAYLPIGTTAKPALVRALDTSVDSTRTTPSATRDAYARFVERRRRHLGYFRTWRAATYDYNIRPRTAMGGGVWFVERVTYDLGAHEVNVTARIPYQGDPV